MNKTAQKKTEYFAFSDYMKILCVAYVVGLWHMVSYTEIEGLLQIQSVPFLKQCTYCVLATFTFLSGFLAFREFGGMKDAGRYYLKRLIRLWPLFALAETAMVLLGLNDGKMLPWVLPGLGWLKEPFPLTLWFVGMIFLFYLLNPVISSKKLLLAIGVSVLAEALFVILNLTLHTDERLWFYWPLFVAGNMVRRIPLKAWITKLNSSEVILMKAAAAVVCLAGFTAVTVFLPGEGFSYKTYIEAMLFIAGGISLFSLIKNKTLNGIVKQIAYATMCTYLFHRVFFTILCKMIGKKIGSLPLWILSVILCFGTGYLIQFVYEKAAETITGMVTKKSNSEKG